MKLSLGFSPCPNDTFIFDAMIHHKIDTEGLEFDVSYEDVETLNQKAFSSSLDITKLSYHAYAYVSSDYVLMDSGSALGFGVGPLLICNEPHYLEEGFENFARRAPNLSVAIPGQYTTANLLLGLAFPEIHRKVEMKFFEIENALLNKKVDLGVIIHENRFTYESKGLLKIIDLGDYWEKLTSCPIPLGGIMIKRSLPAEVGQKVNRIIERSVRFAMQNPLSGIDFIKSHAQEMSTEVMYKHIELYVNKFSVNLGETGRAAVERFFKEARERNIIPVQEYPLFLSK